MVRISVGSIVQNHRLCKVSSKNAEIFDVVSKNAGAIVLIQTVSATEKDFKHPKISALTNRKSESRNVKRQTYRNSFFWGSKISRIFSAYSFFAQVYTNSCREKHKTGNCS